MFRKISIEPIRATGTGYTAKTATEVLPMLLKRPDWQTPGTAITGWALLSGTMTMMAIPIFSSPATEKISFITTMEMARSPTLQLRLVSPAVAGPFLPVSLITTTMDISTYSLLATWIGTPITTRFVAGITIPTVHPMFSRQQLVFFIATETMALSKMSASGQGSPQKTGER